MINRNNFMGLDGFVWWFGVIENRKDPLQTGRCQVRIFGWHTEDKNLIPTEDLPWAHPVMPLNTNTATGLAAKEGDMVFGFFLDSDDAQFPVMIGIVPGIPDIKPNISKGFSDQRTVSNLASAPKKPVSKIYDKTGKGVSIVEGSAQRYPININESTTSRLTRNENINQTIVQERKNNRALNVPTSAGLKSSIGSSGGFLSSVVSGFGSIAGGISGIGAISGGLGNLGSLASSVTSFSSLASSTGLSTLTSSLSSSFSSLASSTGLSALTSSLPSSLTSLASSTG